MGETRSTHGGDYKCVCYKILVLKLERRRQLRISMSGCADNIKTDLTEIRFGMWIGFIRLGIGTNGGLL
jgi:hypothetical protein